MGGELFSNAEFGYYKVIQFDTNITEDCVMGRLYWDKDNATVAIGMIVPGVCLQVGQEMFIYAKNTSGSIITNGTPVYISGASGNNIEIAHADASAQDNARKLIAVATHDIGINAHGYVTTYGYVRDINTSAFDEGDEIFLAVGGGLTKTKPALPNAVVKLGVCTRSNANIGAIYVAIDVKSVKDILTDSGDLTIRSQAQKTVVLEQPVWDDIIIPITHTRIPVANFPTWTSFVSPLFAYTFAVNDYVEFSFEMPHDYKEGTDLDCHIHGATNGLEGTDKYIKFQLDYTISANNYNLTTGIGSVFTNSASISHEFKIPANTTDRSGFYFDIGDILGTDIKIGSQVHCKLSRITSSGTAVAANPFISTFGIHYQIDTIGSRQEYVK